MHHIFCYIHIFFLEVFSITYPLLSVSLGSNTHMSKLKKKIPVYWFTCV